LKTISYKGRVVFKKMPMPSFKRIAREYYENEACFAFITQGEYKVRDQNSLLDINQETALLAKCTNYFYESNVYPMASEPEGEVIGVFLYPDIYQQLFNFDLTRSTHNTTFNLKQFAVDGLLAHYRNSINILLDEPELADEMLVENKLREFVILMTKKLGAPSEIDFLASMFKPHFAKFEEVIQQNLYADLSLDELAKLCHMSLSTFKRKFSEVYTESPKKYITRLKIDKALPLLKQQDLRISEIVFQTGFDSVSTFNRAFKAKTGKTPSQYRLG
tara:strand:+ start:64397 stop:65221 length:825 start_codon:yes stop_codon:yes gene_type:complete